MLRILGAMLVAAVLTTCSGGERSAPLVDSGRGDLDVMDFRAPFALDPLPAGWWHRKFFTRAPMTMSLASKDGVPAVRLETNGTASMLMRFTDVELAARPLLSWRWFVEVPVDSPLDELTRAGDDHPARFYIAFKTASGERRAMEIIWGNKVLKRGDWKYLGTFPHYVANGGNANVGRWHDEQVDLAALYREIWKDQGAARIEEIALFCDTDETKTRSVAYFADVRLKRRG